MKSKGKVITDPNNQPREITNLMTEHNAQRLLVAWFRGRYPDLEDVFFAIPNGGKRSAVAAKRLKDEGVLPGVPDLMLAVPMAGAHGLYVEMKTTTGSARKTQRKIHAALTAQGYAVEIAKGYEEAKRAIVAYLEGEGS